MGENKTDKSIEDTQEVTKCDTCGQVIDTGMFEKREGDTSDGRCFYYLAEED